MAGYGKLLSFRLVVLVSFFNAGLFAQGIEVKFRVTDDAMNVLKGATVRLYHLNHLDTVVENAPSVIELPLKQDTYYTIEVELTGFVTKRLGIFTDLHKNMNKKEEYRFFVTLERSKDYESYKDAENVLDYPSYLLEFDTNTGVFNYNEQYYLSTQQAFEKLYRSKREIKF